MRNLQILLAVVLQIALSGCALISAGPGPYRLAANEDLEGAITKATCEKNDIVGLTSDTTIVPSFIEIDEQGAFEQDNINGVDRNTQMYRSFNRIEADRPTNAPHIVVVYAHGWFHNASKDDDNVIKFRCALAMIEKNFRKQEPFAKVSGVYIGWRGKSVKIPYVHIISFWDRKNTSEEVGRGELVEYLIKLERRVKNADTIAVPLIAKECKNLKDDLLKKKCRDKWAEEAARQAKKNRLLLVGHSFGGSVVFNAIGQIMLARLIESGKHVKETRLTGNADDDKTIRGYGDLVVLVNPAIEAMRLLPFHNALRNLHGSAPPDLHDSAPPADPPADKYQPPRLLVLSSLGDWINRDLFPIGRTLSTWAEQYKTIRSTRVSVDCETKGNLNDCEPEHDEWKMDHTTMGMCDNMHTHATLEHATASSPQGQAKQDGKDIAATIRNECALVLKRKSTSKADNPLGVVPVAESVMPGHADVVSEELICMVGKLLGDIETSRQ